MIHNMRISSFVRVATHGVQMKVVVIAQDVITIIARPVILVVIAVKTVKIGDVENAVLVAIVAKAQFVGIALIHVSRVANRYAKIVLRCVMCVKNHYVVNVAQSLAPVAGIQCVRAVSLRVGVVVITTVAIA